MAAMPTSSVVARSACAPSRQRRGVVAAGDFGGCRVFLSAIRGVPEGKSGEDWHCCLRSPRTAPCSTAPEDRGPDSAIRLRRLQ